MNGQKGIGKILSEALDVIAGNPILIVPYVIPVIIVLIGAFVAIGTFVSGAIRPGFEVDTEYILQNVLAIIGFASVFAILAWVFAIVADAFAINITYNALQGKKVTLSEAWNEIGTNKIVMLVVVSIITIILKLVGLLFFCIGYFIVAILLIFVSQGIVLDNLGFDTFGNSYNIAKKNFVDILVLVLIFFVLWILLTRIPIIGGILGILVGIYAVVTYTILYADRK